jgi:hypothetical protein
MKVLERDRIRKPMLRVCTNVVKTSSVVLPVSILFVECCASVDKTPILPYHWPPSHNLDVSLLAF